MATFSEKILCELHRLKDELKIPLFDAASHYCEIHEIDQEDLISQLDSHTLDQLKYSAMSTRQVRRSVQAPANSLL